MFVIDITILYQGMFVREVRFGIFGTCIVLSSFNIISIFDYIGFIGLSIIKIDWVVRCLTICHFFR